MASVSPQIPAEQPSIEADAHSAEDSSDYEDGGASSTSSLTSSIREFVYENGRRYHSYRAGQYVLPNDDTEQDRLDMLHHIFTLLLNGDPCITKLQNPQSILDVGTGTGIWAIEMGDMFPSAKVIGTDLSPIQPSWVPANVSFEVDDATQEWTFPLESFDFIFVRTLSGGIQDWPAFIERCFKHIKPGGKIEIVEGRTTFLCDDGTFPEDSYMRKWLNELARIGSKLGLTLDIIPQMPQILEDANFIDIEQTNKVCPVGPWPKDPALKKIGSYFRLHFLELGLEAYTMALFTRNGWSETETHALMGHVREEVKRNTMHIYTYGSFVTATKPA